ncbi:MAG: chromosome segregation protein SMC, partial [Oscillospiraceae bacterium]
MHLKNIEMQGFKSFADKIYLDFNSGITAIVGPNGSGKSNISDAIKWVMGEQSVKSLRGSKMEDVIFAGTQTRKALGFAEVTLTLDNSDEYFNLDFPEVKVTRRVYRNGDSEYSINKTQCRLKDIHELFMDTGLGRDGYSIIGQGKIDNILSSKSEDRRQIFEEAAGISKYKYRKNEAERKLSQTTENLTRVTDILGELEVQIEPLKRQSEKAKSYLNLRDELKGLDITVSIMSIDKIKSELGGVDSEIDILESQVNSIKSEIEQSEVSIASMYDELEKYDDDMEGCRIADREISDLVHELNNKINIMLSDISHNNENVERLKTELENNNLSIKNLDDNIIKNKAELETLRSQNSAIDASLLELGETSRMAGSQASEKSSEVENLRSEIIIKTSKINTLKGNIENSKVLLENFTSRHDTINRELHDKSTNFDTLSMQCETLKENLSQNEKAGSALKEKILNAKNIHAEKSERYQNSLTEKNNLSLKLSQDSSKRKMLIDMENGFEGFAKGVKCVMTAYKSGNIKNANIHGPLSQLITTDKTYITAIETALGAASQNVVTQNESDAKTAINYLKERKLGRATFLPISAIKGKSFRSDTAESYDGFISIADKLVRCDGQYDNIVSSVLGTTVIVDTLDNAVKMAKGTGQKFRIVTLGGDVIQAGGAMTGGSAIRTAGSLSRSSEIESLGDEISKNEKNLLV